MKYIQLPEADLSVSQICLGTVPLGSKLDQDASFALLDTYAENGGNFIDTARVYSAWLPDGADTSEKTIGAWISARGNRDEIVLATKGAHPDLKSMTTPRMSPADIQFDIEASLRCLQTDVIDIYWLHRDDVTTPAGEIIEMMNEHIKQGTIRYVACSNWSVNRIKEANDYAREHSLAGFVANQPMWSIAEPNRENIGDKTIVVADDEDIAFHRQSQMTMIPYTSQAKGFFSKLEEKRAKESDLKTYDNPTNHARFQRILELSKKHNVTVSTIVLSYVTSQSFTAVPIIGARTIEQLTDSLQDSDLRLNADEVAYLENG